MKLKKVAITLVGIGGTILTGILLKRAGHQTPPKLYKGLFQNLNNIFMEYLFQNLQN